MSRHDQRNGAPRPKPIQEGSDTTWIPEFMSSIAGLTTPLTAESLLVLPLGATAHEREQRLRLLSNKGLLRMRAVRVRVNGAEAGLGEPSVFSHYEWTVE